jgi:hypothetical protein
MRGRMREKKEVIVIVTMMVKKRAKAMIERGGNTWRGKSANEQQQKKLDPDLVQKDYE